jgi:arabinofuranosyltransferase
VLSTRRHDLVVVVAAALALAVFVLTERRIAGAPGFPLDDSWIHLHFARNLAEGLGFVYNPGRPMAGSTAPLWTLLVAGAFAVTGPSVAVAKTVGVATTVAAALVTRRAALAAGASAPAALAAAVGLVWTGALAWGALSGMEVSLATLLVAGALWSHVRARTVWTAILASLAVLARPEAMVLLPLLAFAGPVGIRRVAAFLGAALVVIGPAVVFNLATTGSPLPATASAKVEGGVVGLLTGTREPVVRLVIERPWEFTRQWFAWLATTHWLLPFAVVPGVVAAWRHGGRALGVPALALLLQPVAMALLAPYRGPAFQEGRYAMHLLPLAFVALALLVGPDAGRLRRAVLVVWLVLAPFTLVPAAVRYGWAVQNINAMQVHLGRWVDERLPRTARLALNDIGAIAYVSRREVIDLMGLVTPEIVPYRRQGEAGVARYLAETCPDYVIVFPAWFPELTARPDVLDPVYRVRLQRNEVAGAPEMVVYRVRRCAL